MSEEIEFTLDGTTVKTTPGTSVAAALLNLGVRQFRRSVGHASRTPLCGMGICFECQLSIDGNSKQKSCQIIVKPGMVVRTHE
jgi:D-hydroxyproline dehydrogenase subunit gamma